MAKKKVGDNTKKIHLYDFDGTICEGDTTFKLYLFFLRKNPLIILWLPYQLLFLILRTFSLVSDTRVKEIFLVFLWNQYKVEKKIKEFSDNRQKYLFPKVLDKIKKDKDSGATLICISASPRLYIEEMCKGLGFDYIIATETKEGSYRKLASKNCRGPEKVIRLKQLLKDEGLEEAEIVSMISDSKFDKPLYDLAKEKYMVDEKGNITKGIPERVFNF
ncbi:MAG: HAD-IB family phosphatase [Alphaproteobacteria bacterium]|jgi:HAD superfamily hydrolase (TIGR01490 family)|nr:HAD-IB family phosphatase [Alphaproteobacteria bacterium]